MTATDSGLKNVDAPEDTDAGRDPGPEDADAFSKQALERAHPGHRWPALDGVPVACRITGEPWWVDTTPVRHAMRELMWNPPLGNRCADAAVAVASFLVRAVIMGSADDREIVQKMRDMVNSGPMRRAAAVRAVAFAIERYRPLPGDAKRWSADMTMDRLDMLDAERVHTAAGDISVHHDRIRKALPAMQRAQVALHLGRRVGRLGAHGDAAAWVAKHGEQLPTAEDAVRFVKQRDAEAKRLYTVSGIERHRLVNACLMIDALGRIDPSFLDLDVDDVREPVAKAAARRGSGDGALSPEGCCAKLCVKVGAFGYKNENSARSALLRAVRETSGRRA